jgi:hypothetical protein
MALLYSYLQLHSVVYCVGCLSTRYCRYEKVREFFYQQFTILNHNTLESESVFSYSDVEILKMTPILCFLHCELLGCQTVFSPRRIAIFGKNMLPPSSGLNSEEWRIGMLTYAGYKEDNYSDTRKAWDGLRSNQVETVLTSTPRTEKESFPLMSVSTYNMIWYYNLKDHLKDRRREN